MFSEWRVACVLRSWTPPKDGPSQREQPTARFWNFKLILLKWTNNIPHGTAESVTIVHGLKGGLDLDCLWTCNDSKVVPLLTPTPASTSPSVCLFFSPDRLGTISSKQTSGSTSTLLLTLPGAEQTRPGQALGGGHLKHKAVANPFNKSFLPSPNGSLNWICSPFGSLTIRHDGWKLLGTVILHPLNVIASQPLMYEFYRKVSFTKYEELWR